MLSPHGAAQRQIDRMIFDELVRGDLRKESKYYLVDQARQLHERGAKGIILGCTEFTLLISQNDLPDIPLFDTTSLHVQSILEFAVPTSA